MLHHTVSSTEEIRSVLARRAPRALCGASLEGSAPNTDPVEDQLCPDCQHRTNHGALTRIRRLLHH